MDAQKQVSTNTMVELVFSQEEVIKLLMRDVSPEYRVPLTDAKITMAIGSNYPERDDTSLSITWETTDVEV